MPLWLRFAAMLLLASPLVAGDGYVYTNADLARLEPLPESPGPVVQPADPEGWEFVLEFIARQHARLDAERRFRIEEELALSVRPAERYATPYYGLYPYFRAPRVPRVSRTRMIAPVARPEPPRPPAPVVRIGPRPAPSPPATGRR